MFHDAVMQNILFRLINFVALFIVGVLLFKKKLLPALKKKIQDKILLSANLEQQKQGIKYQQNNIDNALEQQEHLAHELTKKIALWKKTVEQKELVLQEFKDTLQEKMEIKNKIQQEFQAFTLLNKQVLPEAIDDVEVALKNRFDNEALGQQYIHDIITYIKKEG